MNLREIMMASGDAELVAKMETAVLDGFVLVPKEPTEAMLQAGLRALQDQLGESAVIIRDPLFAYRAMIHPTSLPAPPIVPSPSEGVTVKTFVQNIDAIIEESVIGGTDDFPAINRVSLIADLTHRLNALEPSPSNSRAKAMEEAAQIVETALVRDYERRVGRTRGNSEAELFLASAIRRAARALTSETETP